MFNEPENLNKDPFFNEFKTIFNSYDKKLNIEKEESDMIGTKHVLAMICVPFRGKTPSQVMLSLQHTKNQITPRIIDDYKQHHITAELNYLSMDIEVVFYDNDIDYRTPHLRSEDDHSLFCLGNGISHVMSNVDYIVFGYDWEKSRGCLVECITAWSYGKRIFAYTDNKIIKDFEAFKYAVEKLNSIKNPEEKI